MQIHKQSESSINFVYLTECGYLSRKIPTTTEDDKVTCYNCLRIIYRKKKEAKNNESNIKG